jgi:hypothetical protein
MPALPSSLMSSLSETPAVTIPETMAGYPQHWRACRIHARAAECDIDYLSWCAPR